MAQWSFTDCAPKVTMALPCSERYTRDHELKLAQKDTARDGEGEGQGSAKLTREEVEFLPFFPSVTERESDIQRERERERDIVQQQPGVTT